ncbi:hypothetical protein PNK_p0109 (plasmid) [Candidatus Protochlamydia naegleriophila]|uniref:Uncharacterized protein n=1 Tax=Candidatus Protochlamydia naegleriophila TaxID=389348 RepID=A0A0U5EV71_9BACT|nr:hypothetical protein [Candidatus Protochlamydia naegleriophila]CUI18163.1 hypothetical protein PNK_p0109 [Candidatus Protochlamydia naegleriophila]
MQQTCHNAIWNSNVLSDWYANEINEYAQTDNPCFNLFKARVLAATMPAFLALQLSFELLLVSIPRAFCECVVVLSKAVVQLASFPETSLKENSSLIGIEPEEAVSVNYTAGFDETLPPERLIQRLTQNNALLESIRTHRFDNQASWKTITDRTWETNENCTRLKRLIYEDTNRFYLELGSPELGSHFFYECLTYPWGKAYLEFLIRETPKHFLDKLVKRNAYAELGTILPNDQANLHDLFLGNAQDPRYQHLSEDSLLDSIIKQSPNPEQSANLLRLFEECIPDLWMRLVFRHGYQLPIPIAEIQPNVEMSLEKRLEHAIIMKSVDLLKELCQQMNDASFKLAMKRLRNRYPAFNAEILELEQQVSPRFGLGFFDGFVDIDLVFQA